MDMERRPRYIDFGFLGTRWLFALRPSAYMETLLDRYPDVREAVGPGRLLGGLTIPETDLVVIYESYEPHELVNVVVHELYHVASCARYKKYGEELRAICMAQACEEILAKLGLTKGVPSASPQASQS